MCAATTLKSEAIKDKLLVNPKRILNIGKHMGANVARAERIYNELKYDSHFGDNWLSKLDEMVDIAVMAIIDSLRTEFRKQGLGEFDVEKYFLRAMLELKRGTPTSIKRAQESIKRAKTEAKRLEKIKKEALHTIFEIETILKETREESRTWLSENEYEKMENSLKEILKASERGNYELALHLAKTALRKSKELRDLKHIALRYAAKAGHVVGKVKSENPSSSPNETFSRLNNLLNMIKDFLADESYQTALLLAKEVKFEAEKLLPEDKIQINNFVCPLCFGTICPNSYCNLSISPSPLLEETCRTYCNCGTYYHICCVQKGENLTCPSCHKPLRG
ncbi:MAG: hypothetical protein JSV09_09025 [Thermoplasmata archaeon]|nr:MAG: hypothetical protein JSV09_09025 [Thermoplasmata archaeon]